MNTKIKFVLLVLMFLLALGFLNASVPTALANISPSTFEGNDGNLLVNTTGHTDWCNEPIATFTGACPTANQAPNLAVGIDQPSGSSDNAFGQGTKEDNPNVTIVTGSIPPNKSDLTRFYVASEKVGTPVHNFLYLAWERTNVLGSANMDFEINQKATAGFTGTTTGAITLNRTAGDLLITFDFGGSGVPDLGLLRWLTAAAGNTASQCFSSSSLPCWGNRVDLTAAGDAEGAVNSGTVLDPINPNAPRSLIGNTFGEASVDLTAAGVFPAGTCKAFGSDFLKSRSSASFTAEVKDFVAPVPITISNCGTIVIKKVTVPAGQTDTFGYTTTGGLTPSTFSLTGASGSDTQTYVNVPGGTYSVTENDPTPAYDLSDLKCAVNPGGTSTTSTSTTTRIASITLVAGDTVTCTYTNTKRGTIVVKKVTVPSPDPTTTSFSFTPTGFNGGASFTEKDGGSQSFGNLVPTTTTGGPYSVSESDPSSLGFDLTSSSCDNGTPSNITVNPGGTTTCTFTNTLRLGAIRVTKESSKPGNALLANAKFVVKDGNGNVVTNGNLTTGSNGTACVDHLLWAGTGTAYTVTETQAPNGYAIDNNSAVTVTVDHNADCNSTTGVPNAPAAFTDTPLTDVSVTATSEVTGGTQSTITCVDSTNAAIGNSPQGPAGSPTVTANGLKPGTYTCTVVIDP